MEELLKKGADVTGLCGEGRTSALQLFVKDKNAPLGLVAKLAKNGMLNAQDENGCTALHIAVVYGSLTIIKELKKLGAKRIRTAWNLLPISCHSGFYEPEIFHELLEDDAEFNVKQCIFIFFSSLRAVHTNLLQQMLQVLCERMSTNFLLSNFHWVIPSQNNVITYPHDFRHLSFCVQTNSKHARYVFSLPMGKVQSFCKILFELPGRICDIPRRMLSDQRLISPETAQVERDVDKLLAEYAERKATRPLSSICRDVIRKALHPVRSTKIAKLPLPPTLKLYICQTDVANYIHSILQRCTTDTRFFGFEVVSCKFRDCVK